MGGSALSFYHNNISSLLIAAKWSPWLLIYGLEKIAGT
jgi:hypothetical protein